MFVRIDSVDKELEKDIGEPYFNKETIFKYDSEYIHKVFDRYFWINEENDENKEEYDKQFKEYQDAYCWLKKLGDLNEIESMTSKTFFKDTDRSEYLIVTISNDEDDLKDEKDERSDEINE